MDGITRFKGEHRYLSNFYPCTLNFQRVAYPSAEHAFQAQKTRDLTLQQVVAAQPTPGDAKKYGRQLECRDDWEQIKKTVMLQVVLTKFRQHGTLTRQLIDTEDALLIEGNDWHDNYWGHCFCGRRACSEPGKNYLGQILMAVRMVMREDS